MVMWKLRQIKLHKPIIIETLSATVSESVYWKHPMTGIQYDLSVNYMNKIFSNHDMILILYSSLDTVDWSLYVQNQYIIKIEYSYDSLNNIWGQVKNNVK